jgi:hypothetical protein
MNEHYGWIPSIRRWCLMFASITNTITFLFIHVRSMRIGGKFQVGFNFNKYIIPILGSSYGSSRRRILGLILVWRPLEWSSIFDFLIHIFLRKCQSKTYNQSTLVMTTFPYSKVILEVNMNNLFYINLVW